MEYHLTRTIVLAVFEPRSLKAGPGEAIFTSMLTAPKPKGFRDVLVGEGAILRPPTSASFSPGLVTWFGKEHSSDGVAQLPEYIEMLVNTRGPVTGGGLIQFLQVGNRMRTYFPWLVAVVRQCLHCVGNKV